MGAQAGVKPPRPLALRALSAEKWLKHQLGRGPRLTVERVREIAAMATGGLTDGGEPYYEEGLDVLLESAREADLTWAGRFIVEQMVWSALGRRFQLVDHVKRNPEQNEAVLPRPFLIMGMARTGTTHLHRLLSLDPAFYGIPMWELIRPFPPMDGPDDRHANAWADYERNAKKRGGRDQHIHHSTPDTPEECSLLLMSMFTGGLYWGAAPLHRYCEWTLERGLALTDEVYRDHRQFLLAIQAQHPGQALSLKAPSHFPAIGSISRVLPEAMMIHTVRHPTSWVTSGNSLCEAGHRATARRIDPVALGAQNARTMEVAWDAHRRARGEVSAPIIDVYYDDIVNRPIEVVRSIYDFHGVAWPDDHDARLQDYLDANPRSRHGGHAYRASDFGMTDADIAARFAGYIDYFGLD